LARVKVVYDALFSDVARQHEEVVSLDRATLRDLIEALTKRYGPGFGELVMDPQGGNTVPGVAVLVNGRRLALDSPLNDGDEVAFLRPIAGG
jgi:MoaD family protein